MKNLIFLLCFFTFFNCSSAAKTENSTNSYQKESENLSDLDLMKNIENKIQQALGNAMVTKKPDELEKLSTELKTLREKKSQSLIAYWSGYLEFYKSIYYQNNGNKEKAKKSIEYGIELIKGVKNKNSEDYALYSILESFSLQFAPGFKIPIIAKRIKSNAKRAIAMDTLNIRAYFVYASNDFYTPENYGGGKEAEKYLLKAISLKSQTVKNEYLPSWGKKESYEMLIKLYIKKENWKEAKKHFADANKLFPNDYLISKLAVKLIGH